MASQDGLQMVFVSHKVNADLFSMQNLLLSFLTGTCVVHVQSPFVVSLFRRSSGVVLLRNDSHYTTDGSPYILLFASVETHVVSVAV